MSYMFLGGHTQPLKRRQAYMFTTRTWVTIQTSAKTVQSFLNKKKKCKKYLYMFQSSQACRTDHNINT